MPGDEIDAALHEDPVLADRPAPELVRQREAPRRMMPEEIVGDEDVIADRREVAADRVDRPLAHRAGVQLPDRAERAAERAASRRFDQPDRTMREARVLPAPRGHVLSRRQRHVVQRERRRSRRRVRMSPPSPSGSASPGTVVSGRPRSSAAHSRGIARSPSSSTTADDVLDRNGAGYAAAVCPPTTMGTSGESARTRAASASTSSVSSACIAAMPTSAGRRRAHLVLERAAEAEIGQRDAVAAGFERRGDVLHAERLDAEEGTEAEPLVAGNGTQQQNIHARRARVTRDAGCYTAVPAFIVVSLVTAVVATAYRRRTLVIAALVVCARPVGCRRATRVVRRRRAVAAPRDGRVIPAFRQYLGSFGSVDQLYVVFTAPADHAVGEYAEEIDDWVDRLRQAPEMAQVDAGVADGTRNFSWLADRELLLLGGKPLDAALQRLSAGGNRRRRGVPSRAAGAAVVADGRHGPARSARPDRDRQRHARIDRAGAQRQRRQARLRQRGRSQPSGDRAAGPAAVRHRVLSRARRAPRDRDIGAAVDAGEASRAADLDEPLPPLQVEFAGGHRIAVETEAVVRRESILNTVGSLALILPLLFFTFRSLWLVLVGALPSALSLLVVLGILGFTGATLSAAAAGSAAMLFGLGIDGVVLLYVAHRLAVRRRTPAPTGLSRPWPGRPRACFSACGRRRRRFTA